LLTEGSESVPYLVLLDPDPGGPKTYGDPVDPDPQHWFASIGLNADPNSDPKFYLNADPVPDLDPCFLITLTLNSSDFFFIFFNFFVISGFKIIYGNRLASY
jgi:hypothetical protein